MFCRGSQVVLFNHKDTKNTKGTEDFLLLLSVRCAEVAGTQILRHLAF